MEIQSHFVIKFQYRSLTIAASSIPVIAWGDFTMISATVDTKGRYNDSDDKLVSWKRLGSKVIVLHTEPNLILIENMK